LPAIQASRSRRASRSSARGRREGEAPFCEAPARCATCSFSAARSTRGRSR
jgi:hypothetical protein